MTRTTCGLRDFCRDGCRPAIWTRVRGALRRRESFEFLRRGEGGGISVTPRGDGPVEDSASRCPSSSIESSTKTATTVRRRAGRTASGRRMARVQREYFAIPEARRKKCKDGWLHGRRSCARQDGWLFLNTARAAEFVTRRAHQSGTDREVIASRGQSRTYTSMA